MTPTAWLFRKPTDGAGAGKHVVFAVVWGQVAGALPVDGRVLNGRQRRGRGMGSYRTSLGCTPTNSRDLPATAAFVAASRRGFPAPGWKTITSGHQNPLKGKEIIARCEAGEAAAEASLERYEESPDAQPLANRDILDPDVIVLAGVFRKCRGCIEMCRSG